MDVKEKVIAHVNRDGSCGFGAKEANEAKSVQDLINLLLTPKGIEHCMEYRWPTLEMMLPYRNELENNGIYITGSHGIVNPRLVVVFGGNVSVSVSEYNVCEVYATNGAIVEVQARDNAFVTIELHHGAKAATNITEQAKVKEFIK